MAMHSQWRGLHQDVGTKGGIHRGPLTNNLLKYYNIIPLYQLQTGFTSFAPDMEIKIQKYISSQGHSAS